MVVRVVSTVLSFLDGESETRTAVTSRNTGKFIIRPSVNADYNKKLREGTLLAAKPERTINFFEKMKIMVQSSINSTT